MITKEHKRGITYYIYKDEIISDFTILPAICTLENCEVGNYITQELNEVDSQMLRVFDSSIGDNAVLKTVDFYGVCKVGNIAQFEILNIHRNADVEIQNNAIINIIQNESKLTINDYLQVENIHNYPDFKKCDIGNYSKFINQDKNLKNVNIGHNVIFETGVVFDNCKIGKGLLVKGRLFIFGDCSIESGVIQNSIVLDNHTKSTLKIGKFIQLQKSRITFNKIDTIIYNFKSANELARAQPFNYFIQDVNGKKYIFQCYFATKTENLIEMLERQNEIELANCIKMRYPNIFDSEN